MTFQEHMSAMGVHVLLDDYRAWRMCQGKRRYSTIDAAGVARRYATQHPKAAERPLQVYYCEHCFGWHIGHLSKGALPAQRPAEATQ